MADASAPSFLSNGVPIHFVSVDPSGDGKWTTEEVI